jgi:hypothetical protein
MFNFSPPHLLNQAAVRTFVSLTHPLQHQQDELRRCSHEATMAVVPRRNTHTREEKEGIRARPTAPSEDRKGGRRYGEEEEQRCIDFRVWGRYRRSI